jgi:hypothetical protein
MYSKVQNSGFNIMIHTFIKLFEMLFVNLCVGNTDL